MEHKSYSPQTHKSNNSSISRSLLGTLETANRNAHALYSLQRLDSEQKLEPYLYEHILSYQSFDPKIHTSQYAIKTNNLNLLKYLLDNDLWDVDIIDALNLALQYLSDDVFIYLTKTFRVPIETIEDEINWDKVPIWEGEPYSSWSLKLTLFFVENFDPREDSNVEHIMMSNAVNSHDIELVSTLVYQRWGIWCDALRFYGYLRDTLDIDIIKYLVEQGADPSCGMTSTILGYRSFDILNYLIEQGADPDIGLANAYANFDIDIVKYFVEQGANPNPGIERATSRSKLDIIKYLVEQGADPNRGIERAIDRGKLDIVKYLVEQGADPNRGIEEAIDSGKLDIVKYLVEQGADPNAGIERAIDRGKLDIIKYLVEQGADIRSIFADINNIDIVNYLVMNGVVDANYAILRAARFGHLKTVKFLVEFGNATNLNEALGYAIEYEHIDVIKYLFLETEACSS